MRTLLKCITIVALLLITKHYTLNTNRLYAITPTMESNRYRIEWGNVNIGANEESSTNYKLSTTLGQLAAGSFQSNGYVVKAGFQYMHAIIPFRFSVSRTNLNLGTLTPNVPATATTTLTVHFGSAGNYQVTTGELGPLKTLSGNNIIPNTQCDGGASNCDELNARPWNSSTAYGFGYSLSGQDIPTDFLSAAFYRPFPDVTAGKSPATVMASNNVGKNRQATMTVKANISAIQVSGSYQTVINFVATPSF